MFSGKIWIVLQREYLNMVQKRSFWLSTFLVPLGFALIFGIQIISALFVEKESYTLLVPADSNPYLKERLKDSPDLKYVTVTESIDALKKRVGENESEILLQLPDEAAVQSKNPQILLTASRTIAGPVSKSVRNTVSDAIKTYKMEQAGLSPEQLSQMDFELEVESTRIEEGKEKSSNTLLATGLGFGMSFLMYMLVAIFGSILMQGVIEEKNNRIVEVIVSSVRPFDLLMGKTVALALTGLTQMIMWGVLSLLITTGMSIFAASAGVSAEAMQQPEMAGNASAAQVQEVLNTLSSFNWNVLWFFPLFFLGGFFLYGSLLAAAGSAVDNIQDAQQFTLPITIPLILPMLFLNNILQNPNGLFATITSLIPFFSPMIMMVRMGMSTVPWYEVLLSLVLLFASFIGTVWIAGRIYRVGILMYGKKPTFAELFKWIRYKS
jgi:ABC-2 type transport system permease protein